MSSNGMYCGNDVGALVIDFGSETIRCGFAGDDLPKCDLPTNIGCLIDDVKQEDNISEFKTSKKYYFKSNEIYEPKSFMEIENPLKDSMIENFDIIEAFLQNLFQNHLYVNPEEHPILLTEPSWNENDKREKIVELLFEKFNVPASFISKSPVLAGFAHGRGSCLVVDSGASQTSVNAIHDGLVLKQALVRSPLAGDIISMQCSEYFNSISLNLYPQYQIKSKSVFTDKSKPVFQIKQLTNITPSYHSYMIKNLLADFKCRVLQVSDIPIQESNIFSPSTYEFPNGYVHTFEQERFSIPECLFNSSGLKGLDVSTSTGIHHLVTSCVGICDTDLRSTLLGNIVIIGGTTLLPGYTDRLLREVSNKFPQSIKVKCINNITTNDKKMDRSSWVGGSIVGSLNTFHEIWFSKKEYEEMGKSGINRKCP